jgi:hypothetical protein
MPATVLQKLAAKFDSSAGHSSSTAPSPSVASVDSDFQHELDQLVTWLNRSLPPSLTLSSDAWQRLDLIEQRFLESRLADNFQNFRKALQDYKTEFSKLVSRPI